MVMVGILLVRKEVAQFYETSYYIILLILLKVALCMQLIYNFLNHKPCTPKSMHVHLVCSLLFLCLYLYLILWTC